MNCCNINIYAYRIKLTTYISLNRTKRLREFFFISKTLLVYIYIYQNNCNQGIYNLYHHMWQQLNNIWEIINESVTFRILCLLTWIISFLPSAANCLMTTLKFWRYCVIWFEFDTHCKQTTASSKSWELYLNDNSCEIISININFLHQNKYSSVKNIPVCVKNVVNFSISHLSIWTTRLLLSRTIRLLTTVCSGASCDIYLCW